MTRLRVIIIALLLYASFSRTTKVERSISRRDMTPHLARMLSMSHISERK